MEGTTSGGGRVKAIVLHPVFPEPERVARNNNGRTGHRPPERVLEEACKLAAAIDLNVVSAGLVRVASPRPATLFGRGKVAELKSSAAVLDAELVIVDGPLTPIQQRNLERAWNAKVLDRTGLILEIFGDRAQTREGRLQADLAHLTYQRTRLVRSWTHLERQRGGVGFLGGPGETQIEADRRVLGRKKSPTSNVNWNPSKKRGRFSGGRENGCLIRSSRLWAIPMRESRPCSTRSRKPMFSLTIYCSPLWIPP